VRRRLLNPGDNATGSEGLLELAEGNGAEKSRVRERTMEGHKTFGRKKSPNQGKKKKRTARARRVKSGEREHQMQEHRTPYLTVIRYNGTPPSSSAGKKGHTAKK